MILSTTTGQTGRSNAHACASGIGIVVYSVGVPEAPGQEHDVHHKLPFRSFGYVPGVNDRYCLANELENLMLVCRGCHRRLETAGRLRTGLDGLAYVLANLAPLHLMCDRTDLGVHVARSEQRRRSGDKPESWADGAPEGKDAAIYLYERVPAGLGFSAQLFELHSALLQMAHELVARCPCREGCPSCIGPVLVDAPAQLETKRLTLGLLRALSGEAF